jgi:hypothetical protein
MFGLNWQDPETLWLNLTNLALGLITLAAVALTVAAVGRELLLRRRKAWETGPMDMELDEMLHRASPHVLQVPGLGLTMADGGRPTASDPECLPPTRRAKE